MESAFLRQRALALWNEGQLYHFHGELERAIDLYSQSIEVFPTAEAYTYRGWAYSSLSNLKAAIRECKKAIKTDPTFGNPYNDIGCYLVAMGKLDRAIRWLEKAKNAPRYDSRESPFMNLGKIYATKGMIRKSIEEYRAALGFAPGNQLCLAALADLEKNLH